MRATSMETNLRVLIADEDESALEGLRGMDRVLAQARHVA